MNYKPLIPVIYKIVNGTTELEAISSDDIVSVKEVKDKDGNTQLMVNWYDDEFCINSTFICDRLEKL